MNRTLVISIDALITADIPVLERLPNLGRIMKGASYAKDILCVYPTLTYPCHAAIATGCYPDRTGIVNNEMFQPLAEGRADWFWFRRDIKVPTVIDYAKARGLSTATVTWPVMGDSGADYNIGEIWAPAEQDDPAPYFDQVNSPAVKDIFARNKGLLCWMKTPQMDEFATQCAVDIIREHRPDLMLLHLSYIDHRRHSLGVHSPELCHAFDFIDAQIGRVLEALEETGGVEETNIVLLGDHGQLYCDRLFHINSVFREMGWLKQENGVIRDYDVYAAQCAFSAQVYVKPGVDKDMVYRGLQEIQRKYPDCIERIFTKEEAAAMHLAGDFDFVLEAGDRVAFSKLADQDCAASTSDQITNYKLSISNHGHLPQKGDKPPFIVSGPDALKGAVVTGGRLVDEAPTILGLLGIEAEGMDGQVLDLIKR